MSYNISKLITYAIKLRSTKDFSTIRNQSANLLQGSAPLQDSEILSYLNSIFSTNLFSETTNSDNLTEFTNNFANWLNSSSSQISGLENFESDFSSGTTQSFDSFYYRHRDKRFRCLTGEYFYHLKIWSSTNSNWKFVSDDDPLQAGDAFVLSLPFCDTGTVLKEYQSILAQCDALGIPVLIDCCYYVLAGGINLDLNYDCIDTVAFSLSKAYNVAHQRIGVRYTRYNMLDGQKLHHTVKYNHALSAYVGNKIIQRFTPDYLFNKYRQQQLEFCEYAKLTPSDSVLFASGDSSWDAHSRKNLLEVYELTEEFDASLFNNRILLQPIFENWDIFEAIRNEN